MNLVVLCSGCGAVFRCMQGGDPTTGSVKMLVGEDSEFWPDKYVCPKCGAQAAGSHEEDMPRAVQVSSIVDLTAEELYSALYGLGLPNENNATLEMVNTVIRGTSIKKVVGKDIPNTGRCMIDYIELFGGVRIYLGASTHGAVVYRVVAKPTYAEKVLKEEEERGSHL